MLRHSEKLHTHTQIPDELRLRMKAIHVDIQLHICVDECPNLS